MKRRLTAAVWVVTIALAYFAGYAFGPAGSAAADQAAAGAQQAAGRGQAPLAGALPPGAHSKIQLSPDQGEPTLFSGTDLRKFHAELQARVKQGGASVLAPRDLLKPMLTRTHSFTIVHRGGQSTQPGNPEQHEGVTDVYFVVGGSGTVVVVGGTSSTFRRTRRTPRWPMPAA